MNKEKNRVLVTSNSEVVAVFKLVSKLIKKERQEFMLAIVKNSLNKRARIKLFITHIYNKHTHAKTSVE